MRQMSIKCVNIWTSSVSFDSFPESQQYYTILLHLYTTTVFSYSGIYSVPNMSNLPNIHAVIYPYLWWLWWWWCPVLAVVLVNWMVTKVMIERGHPVPILWAYRRPLILNAWTGYICHKFVTQVLPRKLRRGSCFNKGILSDWNPKTTNIKVDTNWKMAWPESSIGLIRINLGSNLLAGELIYLLH